MKYLNFESAAVAIAIGEAMLILWMVFRLW